MSTNPSHHRSSSYPPTAHWTSTGLPSRTSYHPALCFSSSVIFLSVDACQDLTGFQLVFYHTLIKNIIHSFIHRLYSLMYLQTYIQLTTPCTYRPTWYAYFVIQYRVCSSVSHESVVVKTESMVIFANLFNSALQLLSEPGWKEPMVLKIIFVFMVFMVLWYVQVLLQKVKNSLKTLLNEVYCMILLKQMCALFQLFAAGCCCCRDRR